MKPRFFISIPSHDVASNVWHALTSGPTRHCRFIKPKNARWWISRLWRGALDIGGHGIYFYNARGAAAAAADDEEAFAEEVAAGAYTRPLFSSTEALSVIYGVHLGIL